MQAEQRELHLQVPQRVQVLLLLRQELQPEQAQQQAQRELPLQVQQGDLALFLQKNAIEIKYNGRKYFIVPQNAILLVEREDF